MRYEAPTALPKHLTSPIEPGSGMCCSLATTKLFEEFKIGTVGELAAYYAETPPRGEVVILLAAADPKPMNEEDLRDQVKALREAGLSAKDVAERLSAETGLPRNAVYRLAVKN